MIVSHEDGQCCEREKQFLAQGVGRLRSFMSCSESDMDTAVSDT